MDSFLSKFGPLKALVPTKTGRHSEGSDALQMQSRPIRVCVCPSPSLQSKQNQAVATGTQNAQETSTCTADPPFSPLPLPSSRTSVPAPLRFLWFNKKDNDASAKNREPGDGHALHLLALSSVESTSHLLLSPQNSESTGEASCASGLVEETEKKWENPENETLQDRCIDAASMQEMRHHPLSELEIVPNILSNAIEGNADLSSPSAKRSWISAITDLKALWPHSKAPTDSTMSSDVARTTPNSRIQPTHDPECEGSCGACDTNASDGFSLELPYNKVLHSKESFSKFLQDASLFDMKVLEKMSFLCDMAYTIPDIQPGQLLKHHHLKFITSSLDKKAEAEAMAMGSELSKKGLVADELMPCGEMVEGSSSEVEASRQTLGGNLGGSYTIDGIEELADGNPRDMLKSTDEKAFLALAPVAALVLAEEETKLAKNVQTSGSCPCEWFVCDDESMHTRYFVIQGSESLAAWQTNLSFDPTKFEGLDVLVHRGIYEAANALYEQVLPEVLAHFSAHGDLAQFRFTGHSLGGSLGTLLSLMFQIRDVLPRKSILPVITFGAPCIMCGGDHLLQTMGLPLNHIQSIIMHRDVVPRAFSCDYPDHIAQILKRLNGKFRDHPCLNQQKLLFAPMGQLLILQPDEAIAPSHPLLPFGHGLYLLRHPSNDGERESAIELRAAQRAFLNMPHPLEILSVPGAYGLNGTVSRNHNPRSYADAIRMVLKQEARRLRRVQREQRRQQWWPLVMADSAAASVRTRFLYPGVNVDQINLNGALAAAIGKTSMFLRQPVSNGSAGWMRSALGSGSMGAFRRYARLIASKHVQMGVLVIVSLRVVIMECLHTLHAWI